MTDMKAIHPTKIPCPGCGWKGAVPEGSSAKCADCFGVKDARVPKEEQGSVLGRVFRLDELRVCGVVRWNDVGYFALAVFDYNEDMSGSRLTLEFTGMPGVEKASCYVLRGVSVGDEVLVNGDEFVVESIRHQHLSDSPHEALAVVQPARLTLRLVKE